MSFSPEQQKQYTEKLMVAQSFFEWNKASEVVDQAAKDLQETGHTFDIAHQQALSAKSDREIITDGLLFRGLIWMSTFSDYAYKRLYSLAECFPPQFGLSCSDEQSGWEGYPILYITMRQNNIVSDRTVELVQHWFETFAHGRHSIKCPIIYAQGGKFGQLQYEHDVRRGGGKIERNDWGDKKVLLTNTLKECLRYTAENWWYHPATKIKQSG